MGYFSRLACAFVCREDRSYPSPQRQLTLRIQELEDRLDEPAGSCGIRYDERVSAQELGSVLPEHLHRTRDLYAALAIAKRELLFLEPEPETDGGESPEAAIPGQIEFDITDMLDASAPVQAA